MNETPRGERTHIAIFGRRNAGKSSLINALTNQDTAIVSEVKGTTTDPVYKSMELLPLGPVVMIDTPGLDDEGDLGGLRIKKAMQALDRADIAVLVVDAETGVTELDLDISAKIKEKGIPMVCAVNKSDLAAADADEVKNKLGLDPVIISSVTKMNIDSLKEELARALPENRETMKLTGGLVSPFDIVMLVMPIDSAAPKGRLILPQQQVIRDLLESRAISVAIRESELSEALKRITPRLVITDSQVFHIVADIVPRTVPLTSFSMLFARYKGDLGLQADGARAIDDLRDGDRVLIAEGCTHHRQEDDIGTVKLPRLLSKYTGKELIFEHSSGYGYPEDLPKYSLILHCGACMLRRREMVHRLQSAVQAGVPVTNYGVALAYIQGILDRCLECFG